MKIKTIEIDNYKAFYAAETINVDGKNIFIYGENGSGKSSLYYALKDFFQSSIEEIDIYEIRNVFAPDSKKDKGYILVTFNPDSDDNNEDENFFLVNDDKDTDRHVCIADANRLKSFLTYKSLLTVHNVKKGDSINLFSLLIDGVLKHFKYTLTKGKELGELWEEVNTISNKSIGQGKDFSQTKQKRDALNTAIQDFNEAFSELFKTDSPEYILKHTNSILKYFNYNIQIDLKVKKLIAAETLETIHNNVVDIEITYAGKKVEKPHLFLNEAKLSAIAISIYLGLIKRHPQGIKYKILFLDDIFIGLDIANRLPLLKILDSEFHDYQVFLTTYDRPWYEYAKFHIEAMKNWKSFEFYCKTSEYGFDIPLLVEHRPSEHIDTWIKRSEDFYNNGDYKASAVYIRTAFEYILKKACFKENIPVSFKGIKEGFDTEVLLKNIDNYHSQVHNRAKQLNEIRHIKSQIRSTLKADLPKELKDRLHNVEEFISKLNGRSSFKLTEETKSEIESYRKVVMNPQVHTITEEYGLKAELKLAIEAVKQLKEEIN